MNGEAWLASHYLENAIWNFRRLKGLAEKAFEQIDEAGFLFSPDVESNSIGILIQHLNGNMLSRWTDLFISDGEKPDRNRDAEFVLAPGMNRVQLIERWERGWGRLFETLESLGPEDLNKKIVINDKEQYVVESINYHLVHYAYHVGQIIFLAKCVKKEEWDSLSIPKKRLTE